MPEKEMTADGKTWLEVMQEFKPDITLDEADYILWECTCYPFSDEITLAQIKEHFKNITKNSPNK